MTREPGDPENPFRHRIEKSQITQAVFRALQSPDGPTRRAAIDALYTRVGIMGDAVPHTPIVMGFCDADGVVVETYQAATHFGWSPV